MHCPLCFATTDELIPQHGHCPRCDLRFKSAQLHLAPLDERQRYLTHNNDIHDEGYWQFLKPAYDAVTALHPASARGLDFGAGPGPILVDRLRKAGYTMDLYDPFFWSDPAPLAKKYDFILATEVIEHFQRPREEFARLKSLLAPKGTLAIMTAIYSPEIDFESWYYRRDPTHVSFYSVRTLEWIAASHGWTTPELRGPRLAIFRA